MRSLSSGIRTPAPARRTRPGARPGALGRENQRCHIGNGAATGAKAGPEERRAGCGGQVGAGCSQGFGRRLSEGCCDEPVMTAVRWRPAPTMRALQGWRDAHRDAFQGCRDLHEVRLGRQPGLTVARGKPAPAKSGGVSLGLLVRNAGCLERLCVGQDVEPRICIDTRHAAIVCRRAAYSGRRRRRRALAMTDTEPRLIAAAARAGVSIAPDSG